MNQGAKLATVVVLVAAAAGGGYWLGHKGQGTEAGATAAVATDAGKSAKKLLFYRNPMGLPDTSPVPKKDPMGMDYIPVYEGEADNDPASANQIKISTEKVQKLGVRTEPAKLRALDQVVRAAGRIEPVDGRVYAISPRFEGYVERLHVNATGQPVGKGQALFEVYSPELVSAQREYAIATEGEKALKGATNDSRTGMAQLAEASVVRLRNWGISEEQIKALTKSGEARHTLTFRSPVSGVVTEKKALQGMRFMPGDVLYQVVDLSAVWAIADVFEQDVARLKVGAKARVRINAYPDQLFEGKVSYIYPTLKAETRTIPVRIELSNPGQRLKPAMYAQVEIPTTGQGDVVTVPASAVIDSGTRRVVLVQVKEGRFEPREVELGQRGTDFVEVKSGVKDGEQVVVAANFLIDAESNLKAAVGGFGHAAHGGSAPANAEHAGHGAAAPAGHKGEGKVESLDAKAGTISISHAPIASLKWPAMTMEFVAANPALLIGLTPGTAIAFEFVERKPGEWVITSVVPQGAGQSAAPANPHAGH